MHLKHTRCCCNLALLPLTMVRSILHVLAGAATCLLVIMTGSTQVSAFAPVVPSTTFVTRSSLLKMADADFAQETPEDTQERIQALVDNHPVLLFMKGSKLFPQCGFSNTAVQILQSFNLDFHTVDVLSDDNIREGVKAFSQWPTIPQFYLCGEFIGGSDIMIEMYQSGELGEMIEKAKADMI